MFCEASPRIQWSISKLGPSTYQMGSRFICKRVTHEETGTAVATWEDKDGYYGLFETTSEQPFSPENEFKDHIYQAGTSSAVWAIGSNAICKVKTWSEGMELESNSLAFVKANFPHIPIPEVVYSWLDERLHRTYLILRRMQGQTLEDAWPGLTPEQRDKTATTIAQYCHDLTKVTSDTLQSSTGFGVLEPFLNVDSEDSHPSWKPRLLGPLARALFEKYLQRISAESQNTPPVDRFHFYHADLGPTNILVANDGTVQGILDWESAGFYPRFWITAKPYMSAGYCLQFSRDARFDWTDLLQNKLHGFGFVLDMSVVEWYKGLNLEFFNVKEFLGID